ncbi:hypothetical protein [Bacillus subtilis]|uniref:hypothetical protein n=1 Tax=Bacillus subtilis TaxID=1423 RepID=UPI002DBD5358|nr:hypothetical protein [Bacillus subtilis]MEC2335072.1 hypothetical protein [Bacillus subtilis]
MGKTFIANSVNFKEYNFQLNIEDTMESFAKDKDYRSMVETLSIHIESCINSLMHFGDNQTARTMLKNIRDLVEYKCLPFHKCSYYYKAIKTIDSVSSDIHASIKRCIDMMLECVKIIIHQYEIK